MKNHSHLFHNKISSRSKRRISDSKLNHLSFRRTKRSRCGQTILLSPSIRSEGNINAVFPFSNHTAGNGFLNPFLQSVTKTKHVQPCGYLTLKHNNKNISDPANNILDRTKEYNCPTLKRHKSNILFSSKSNSASLPLKNCLSVSTLEESLESIKNPKNKLNKNLSKKVSFSNLQIREYELKLGDHPSCRYGPAITMGWNYIPKKDISLDSLTDRDTKGKRKSVDPNTRFEMLRSVGYSNAEILQSFKNKTPNIKPKR